MRTRPSTAIRILWLAIQVLALAALAFSLATLTSWSP
jgi:hypothetical protein